MDTVWNGKRGECLVMEDSLFMFMIVSDVFLVGLPDGINDM